jgi:excisionase family DNA binding protein
MEIQNPTQHLAVNTERKKLSTTEAAKLLGVKYTTLMSWITRGLKRLPAEKVDSPRGAYYLIDEDDLRRFRPANRGHQGVRSLINHTRTKKKAA